MINYNNLELEIVRKLFIFWCGKLNIWFLVKKSYDGSGCL